MKCIKPPLSITDQIAKLKKRGLIFNDEQKAAHYLSNISYYRLRAYIYPFQDYSDPNYQFIKEISFEEIIELDNKDWSIAWIMITNGVQHTVYLKPTQIFNPTCSLGDVTSCPSV